MCFVQHVSSSRKTVRSVRSLPSRHTTTRITVHITVIITAITMLTTTAAVWQVDFSLYPKGEWEYRSSNPAIVGFEKSKD